MAGETYIKITAARYVRDGMSVEAAVERARQDWAKWEEVDKQVDAFMQQTHEEGR